MRRTHKHKMRELRKWFDDDVAQMIGGKLNIDEAEILCAVMESAMLKNQALGKEMGRQEILVKLGAETLRSLNQ